MVATWSLVPEEGDGPPAIGRPMEGTKALIFDRRGRPVPAGVAGELCLGGESLARGYLGRPALTAERFVPDVGGNRLYRTGDLVRHRGDGEIEFLGRLDQQLKIRGIRIEPGEIEAALAAHPNVREAVVAVRDGRLVAWVRGKVEGLRAHLAAHLPATMVPSALVVLDALPLTPNGKVDFRALPNPEWDEGAAPPRTPAEELLAAIWSEVLGQPTVGIHDGFFDLGGHSLLATQVVSRVRTTLGVELPLRSLFESPTVAGLAERVETARRGALAVPPIVPVPRAGELPASFGQERLWFLDQLGEGAVYNVPALLRLRGPLSVPRLAAALDEVVRRHESLRTTFTLADESRVLQVIAPEFHLLLPMIELSEAEARRVAEAEAARPFDLARGPLLRALLLKTGEEENLLLLLMHHIVSDGWSMGVLLHELARLYEGVTLPALPIQYADYAAWQRGWLHGEVLDRQLRFWKQQLAGLPPLLELPSDRQRPAVQGPRGGIEERVLDVRLSAVLDDLCRRKRVTLFMALLASLQTLLGRLTGREDPPVGVPIANRQHAETEGIVGLFVNTLALPSDLSGDPTFSDLLDRVREITLEAHSYQDLPFEKLVEELRLERNLSHSPVFQVLLIVQNAPPVPRSMSDLSLTPVPVETGTAKLDLTLGLMDRSDGRRLQAEYSHDLFDRTTIMRWLGALAGLLDAAAADPCRRLSDLPLLSQTERHQILAEWNETAAAYPLGSCLHELFAAQAERTPDAVAVACQGERVTYSDLLQRSRRIAHRLRALGVSLERPVGVCLERTPDLVTVLLGILQAGGVYVPLDPTYPTEHLAYLLEDCGRGFEAPLVVTREPLLARLGRRVQSICLDRDAPGLACECEDDPQVLIGPENLAYLIYTSGSTGRPKGVAITHSNAVALVHWSADVFPPDDLSGVLASTSINFDLSIFELFVPLSRGGTVILADNALALAALPEAAEVTLINMVPSAMAELLRLEALPQGVRTVNLAGEPLSQGLVAEIEKQRDVRILDLYGPSEDTTYSTFAQRFGSEPATIGRPITNGRAYVLDRWERLAPVGVAGEIWLSGTGLARGYFHRPELTAQRFVPDPFSQEPGQRIYRTGDLARFRTDGCLELLGRIDRQVKVRGFRIELGEVESNLIAHPNVSEAAVLATEKGGERKLIAWVVGNADEELRSFLSARLPAHMVPSTIGFLDALPRLPNGKVDRRALASLSLLGQENREGFVEPEAEDERRIAAAWAEVLGLSRVGLHDDFFKLGGHSLLATRVVARLRRDFGVELPLRALFQAPTVSRLLAAVEEARTMAAAEPVPVAPRIATLSRSASNLRSRSSIGRRESS